MATKKRLRRNPVLWAGATGLLLVIAISTGGLWWVATALSGFGTAVTVNKARPKRKRRAPLPAKGRKASQRRRPVKPMTAGTMPGTARPAAPALAPKVRKSSCSAACQRSTKPASTCDCSCRGSSHGAMVPGTRASILAGRPQTVPAKPKTPARATSRPATAPPKRLPTMAAPKPRRTPEPVHPANADRGWKSLKPGARAAMEGHATTSPKCAGGAVTARTIRDNQTDPPTVTQEVTCDGCGKRLI